jgi:hypothetical protein
VAADRESMLPWREWSRDWRSMLNGCSARESAG